MSRNVTFSAGIQNEYQRLFDTMQVRAGWAAQMDGAANFIERGRTRYQAIERATGVPWFFVGLVHFMEAGGKRDPFTRHLHNGDPLTARTVNVPRGRPVAGNPPFTWEQSATDALRYMDSASPAWRNTRGNWTLPAMLYKLEAYNGFGYRTLARPINSPYLWSGSNHYTRGKYTFDGRYDPNAISKQPGTAVILYRLLERQNLLARYRSGGAGGDIISALAAAFGFFFS